MLSEQMNGLTLFIYGGFHKPDSEHLGDGEPLPIAVSMIVKASICLTFLDSFSLLRFTCSAAVISCNFSAARKIYLSIKSSPKQKSSTLIRALYQALSDVRGLTCWVSTIKL